MHSSQVVLSVPAMGHYPIPAAPSPISAELSPIPTIGGRAVADMATPIVARLDKHHKTLLNIVKHHETNVKHCDTSWTTSETSWNTLRTLWNIMKHSSFDATISALDVKTSAFGAATSAIARRSFDATCPLPATGQTDITIKTFLYP